MTGDSARRLAAHPQWRWLLGMLAGPDGPKHDADCHRLGADRIRVLGEWEVNAPVAVPAGWLPDLNDPATVGCLLAALPPGWAIYNRAEPPEVSMVVWIGDRATRINGESLGIIVAHAWLATREGAPPYFL